MCQLMLLWLKLSVRCEKLEHRCEMEVFSQMIPCPPSKAPLSENDPTAKWPALPHRQYTTSLLVLYM